MNNENVKLGSRFLKGRFPKLLSNSANYPKGLVFVNGTATVSDEQFTKEIQPSAPYRRGDIFKLTKNRQPNIPSPVQVIKGGASTANALYEAPVSSGRPDVPLPGNVSSKEELLES